jgi:glycosyltransferase involved in cell wall biosynthesis
MNPKISVVITCFNRELLIERAIKSVIWQLFQDFEIIIVDDASADRSCEVIRSIDDGRIKLVEHEVNRGQNAAINTALKHARGEFIAFLDSDDIWFPEYLALMLDAFTADVGFVYTWLQNGPRSYLSEDSTFEDVLNQGYLSSMISIVIRSSCMHRLIQFDESLEMRMSQDDQFCFELARYFKFRVVEGCHAMAIGASNSKTNDLLSVALGREFFFRSYLPEIRQKCGSRTIAKYLFEIANLKILGGLWVSGFLTFIRASWYLILPSGKFDTPSYRDYLKKIGVFFYYSLKRIHIRIGGLNG